MFEIEGLEEKIIEIKKFIKNDEKRKYKVLVIHKGEYKTLSSYENHLRHTLGGWQVEAIVATSPQFHTWLDNICDHCVVKGVGCIHMDTIENKISCAVSSILAKQDCYKQFLEIKKGTCRECEKYGFMTPWSC